MGKLAVVESELDQKEVKLNQIADQLRLLREALQQKEKMISGKLKSITNYNCFLRSIK